VPLDEIEELGAEELVESTGSVAVMDEPTPMTTAAASPEVEARIASLEQQLQSKQTALRTVLRELDELRERRVSEALVD
jgi:molecular chaperone GrpE (heat shock protein)